MTNLPTSTSIKTPVVATMNATFTTSVGTTTKLYLPADKDSTVASVELKQAFHLEKGLILKQQFS